MRHIEGLLCILLFVAADAAAPQPLFAQTDWPSYGHDPGGQRYSPLAQVNTQNVTKLKLAWRYGVGGKEVTPLVAGGLMYYSLPAGDFVAALKPETGKEEWKYDLGAGAPLRGVAYWPGDGQNPARIIAGSSDGRLTALNARTGRPIPGFGVEGWVNLKVGVADKFPEIKYQMSSPAGIYKDLIITGTRGTEYDLTGPLQDVRAWDVRTGRLVWTFHLNPHPDEFGNDTWPAGSWVDAASPSAWGAISVDVDRGLVFLPVGQPAVPFYGGQRPGTNLFGSSVIALDATTGQRRWHFQITHHDVWDLDASAIPVLMDVTQRGKTIPAVVVVSKTSLMFFLNRTTGEPIYPVQERPVPQSTVPGEVTSATQPFPVKPPPLSRQSIGADEIFTAEPGSPSSAAIWPNRSEGFTTWGPTRRTARRKIVSFFPGKTAESITAVFRSTPRWDMFS